MFFMLSGYFISVNTHLFNSSLCHLSVSSAKTIWHFSTTKARNWIVYPFSWYLALELSWIVRDYYGFTKSYIFIFCLSFLNLLLNSFEFTSSCCFYYALGTLLSDINHIEQPSMPDTTDTWRRFNNTAAEIW